MLKFRFALAAASALCACQSLPAHAADLFQVTVTSNGVTEKAGFKSALDAIDQFKSGALNRLIPVYTDTSVASGTINYRGLAVSASYPTNGTALRFQVPLAGIDKTFTGTTRNDSQQKLIDYLKKSNAYGSVMHALAASSPVDPLAGNPASLQTALVNQGFNASAFATTPGASLRTGTQSSSRVGLGLNYGQVSGANFNTDAYTVPLSYGFNLGDANRPYRIQIDLPLTYLNTQGAQTGAASLGLGVTVPVAENLSVTPRVAVGATGSVDLASAAAMYAVSVTTAYRINWNDYALILGSMLGYSHSIGISIGSFSVDPKLSNPFTKNGVSVVVPLSKLGLESSLLPNGDLQLFGADTYFTGSKIYENNVIEVGFSVGSSRFQVFGQGFRVGLSYVHGSGPDGAHSNGFTGNLGFTF